MANETILRISEQTGYYRVNYDDATWNSIIRAFPTLSTITRSQLLDDALNLARAGHLDYDTALRLTRQLGREEEVVPLAAAKTAIRFLDRMLHHGDGYQLLQRYLLRLLDGVYNKVRVYTIYLFSIWVQEEDSPSIQRILHFFSEMFDDPCRQY